MTQKLEADSIQLSFGDRNILSGVHISCKECTITGLLGRNGQGKSSLMKVIYGTLQAEKFVRINNTIQHQAFKRPDLLRYLPQFNFIPKHLSLKRIFQDFELDYASFEKRFSGFSSRYMSVISSLSGGEKRLVELYIVATSTSQFVILDEPFTHLNPIQIEQVKELLVEEKTNKGLLITDHMYKHIIDISNEMYVLANGKIFLIKNREDIERLGYAKF